MNQRIAILWVVTLFLAGLARADDLAIENKTLRVDFDSERSIYTITHRASGLKFVDNGQLFESAGEAEIEPVEHPQFGKGRRIAITWPSASVTRLALYEKLPFAVLQTDLHNGQSEPADHNRVNLTEVDVAGAAPVEKLRAFGTFGLSEVGSDKPNFKPPGSYAFLGIVDPASRAGMVMGWLTNDRGSGVMDYEQRHDRVRITARLDHGKLRIAGGTSAPLETLLIGYFADARLGLETYADALAQHHRIKLPRQPTVYCTWYHARASSEKKMREQTDFAAKHLKPFGLDVLQIDDGWQDGQSKNGPRKVFIRHKPNGPYPDGMKPIADYVTAAGMTPGLWFMPYAGTHDDPFFADKQSWFVRKDGEPLDVPWGGTCLDLTVPQVREHVRLRTKRICKEWGYRYIKTDGMWMGMGCPHVYINTGYKEDHLGASELADPNVTHIQAYRTGLKIVREAAGKETYILGCNLAQNMRTLIPSIGLVDAMRVGPDNGPKWGGMLCSAFSGANLYFLHGRVWHNDPDPLYVRSKVPLEQARCFVSFNAVTGQLHASSFQFSELPEERLDLLKRCMPSHNLKPRPVDLFDHQTPRIWMLRNGDRALLGLFNWDPGKPATFTETFARLGLGGAGDYAAFDYWKNEFVSLTGEALNEILPAASCRVLAIRPVAKVPQVISTSRHITQGVVDLTEEKWNADKTLLTGTSRMVAGDRYELRIARPGEGDWKLSAASCSMAGEGDAPKIAQIKEEQAGWRVAIDPPRTGEVSWAVQFAIKEKIPSTPQETSQ